MLIKIQPDATVCRYLFTAKSLHMFRMSQHPPSGVLNSVTAASGTGHYIGTATSFQRGLIRPLLNLVRFLLTLNTSPYIAGCVDISSFFHRTHHLFQTLSLCKAIECFKRAVPLQAWSGPEGSRKLNFPDYTTRAQDGGKVVSPTHRPPLLPGNAPGAHFY